MFNTDVVLPPDYPPSVVGGIGRSRAVGVENQPKIFSQSFQGLAYLKQALRAQGEVFLSLLGLGHSRAHRVPCPKASL